jgi:hypothetical protein
MNANSEIRPREIWCDAEGSVRALDAVRRNQEPNHPCITCALCDLPVVVVEAIGL